MVLWAFVVGALVVVGAGIAAWVAPSTQCRGQEMGPGDTCSYSSYTDTGTSGVQTYEQRIRASQQSAPVVVALGLAAAGFGTVLALHPASRPPEADHPSRDIGP